jgi:plastocyanin
MRTWLAVLALAACNSISGTGKYTVCSDDTCRDPDGGAGGSGSSGTSGSSGAPDAGGGDGAVACDPPGSPVPSCSQGELSQNIFSAPTDARIIKVPSSDQEAPYQPNCMMIRSGQSVTWQGNLTFHPLIPRENSSPNNPIVATPSGVTEVTYAFPCAGTFNFSCRTHMDFMLGTVQVIP